MHAFLIINNHSKNVLSTEDKYFNIDICTMSFCLCKFESHVTLVSLHYFELVSSDLTPYLVQRCVLQPMSCK